MKKSTFPSSLLETTYKAVYNQVVKEYDLGPDIEQKVPKASPPSDSGVHLTTLQTLLIAAVIVGLLILDFVFFKGAITQFLLNFLVMFGGRGGGGGSGGSGPRGGGGGSSGGGGASRGW
ncbi:hypothetical protein [Priestia megaterium]|uniref:hypothetical protein n=1 Tax=Priestia megaterium TaxID=1404 RepID=UPI00203F6584|nr:hypothetical protein [Priestia megaterium]MCM3542438.1 hypothetical protein [Priestia megaterium]